MAHKKVLNLNVSYDGSFFKCIVNRY